MKIPRDLNGGDLAQRLGMFGYRVTRQSGSHMRLTRMLDITEQHLTIPALQTAARGNSEADPQGRR